VSRKQGDLKEVLADSGCWAATNWCTFRIDLSQQPTLVDAHRAPFDLLSCSASSVSMLSHSHYFLRFPHRISESPFCPVPSRLKNADAPPLRTDYRTLYCNVEHLFWYPVLIYEQRRDHLGTEASCRYEHDTDPEGGPCFRFGENSSVSRPVDLCIWHGCDCSAPVFVVNADLFGPSRCLAADARRNPVLVSTFHSFPRSLPLSVMADLGQVVEEW
jgi:hypothetical protein